MVYYGMAQCAVEECSRLSLFLMSVNDTATASSETIIGQMEELQALLLQTYPGDSLQLETICQTGEQNFQELEFVVGIKKWQH